MMTTDRPPTLECMETMLRHCRRRIVMARMAECLREGFRAWLGWLPGIAAVFLVLRLFAWAFETPAPSGAHLLAAILLLGALLFGRALMHQGPVRMVEAAERLDLAQSNHNRIATAMSLLKSGDDSPFARAAIRDGEEALERLKSADPKLDRTPLSWHRSGLSLAATGVLVLAGFFILPKPAPPGSGGDANPIAATDNDLPPGTPETESAATPATRLTATPKTAPSERAEAKPDDAAKKERAKRPEPGSESRSEGAMAKHASGESRDSQAASNSSSAANGEGAKSKPGDNERAKPPKPRGSKPQTAGKPKAEPKEEKKEGGSIDARGSSGAGSMQTAQNEWSSNVKAKADDGDDFQDEEEPDEEMDPDKQRLGAQPALKNRAARVSRELSLFTGADVGNEQNRGRGGPGGQKKSRGTATMIMGVPIPGFVRGRLLPGPTKSTQEEVEPLTKEAAYATATDHPQASPEEKPQERYHPAAAKAARARDYLIQYHTEHDNTPKRSDGDK